MRVATYTERSAATRGSIYALGILILTILLGTGIVPTMAAFAGGVFPQLITPLWLVLYLGAFLALMLNHGINWISWMVRYRLLLVLLLLGTIISVSWSIDAKVSAERVVHLIGSSLVAIYIGFTIPLLITLRTFALMLAFALLASVAVVLGLPELGIEDYDGTPVWRGLFNSKNDLGFWAGTGILLYITLSESFHSITVKILCFGMVVVCLGILVLSQSATSLLAVLVASAFCLYLYIAGRFQLGFIRTAFVAVLLVALTGLAIANIETSELVGRSGDLTGRGEVWRQVLKLIGDHPLTGMGYGSVWFPTDATIWIQQSLFDFTWVVYHAHNGLLQIASEIGIPLALISLLMVAQQLIEILYCQYERQQVGVLFVLGFVVAFLISNYSEARFLISRELFWIFFLALPISMLRQINLVSTEISATASDHETLTAEQSDLAPYSNVQGKPWLGHLRGEVAQVREATMTGVASTSMVALGASQLDDTMDELDLSTATLSLSETDIDLGDLIGNYEDAENAEGADDLDQTLELTGDLQESVDELLPYEVSADKSPSRVSEIFDNDDTYDVDRFDIDFDIPADWLDIDLNDNK